MCGRFTVAYTYKELLSLLDEQFDISDLQTLIEVPRYNVTPSEEMNVVTFQDHRYQLQKMIWGYHHEFPAFTIINGKIETIEEKSFFKNDIKGHRCLIISDGFYEWDKYTKEPYYFQLKDKYFVYPGIYHDGTALILTTKANDNINDIHHRMPVMYSLEQGKKYLQNKLDLHAKENLNPLSNQNMERYKVSKYVNNARHKTHKCVEKEEQITLL